MSEWISVEDRLPEADLEVLTYSSEGCELCCYTEGREDGYDDMGYDAGFIGMYAYPGRSFGQPSYMHEPAGQSTHWMPLPEPPKT